MEARSGVCLLHGDRPAAGAIGACAYCASCLEAIEVAVRGLPLGLAPRECCAAALPGGGWRALASWAGAHWLAHELGVRSLPAQARCAAGFAVRRADLLLGRRELVRELPRHRDLWIDLDDQGCGLVESARRSESSEVEIAIRALIDPARGAATCDFYRDLSGRGRFFR